jgi:hypothetical protein
LQNSTKLRCITPPTCIIKTASPHLCDNDLALFDGYPILYRTGLSEFVPFRTAQLTWFVFVPIQSNDAVNCLEVTLECRY